MGVGALGGMLHWGPLVTLNKVLNATPPHSHSSQTVPLGMLLSSTLPLSLPVGSVATFSVRGLRLWWPLPGWQGGTGGTRFCAQGLPSFKDPSCPETTELQGCTALMSYETKFNNRDFKMREQVPRVV